MLYSALFLYNIVAKQNIQKEIYMLLKHIFSDINISNLLTHVKNIFTIIIFFTLKRLFKNFLLVQLIKLSLFINALCAVALINLKFLVNLDFVPHVVKNMLLFGLIKLLLLSLILSIELYFLPFQKKLESFSFMIELF